MSFYREMVGDTEKRIVELENKCPNEIEKMKERIKQTQGHSLKLEHGGRYQELSEDVLNYVIPWLRLQGFKVNRSVCKDHSCRCNYYQASLPCHCELDEYIISW